MKKYIIGFLVCIALILIMGGTVDNRNTDPNAGKVFRIEVPTLTVPSAGHATEQTTDLNLNGIIRQITVNINNNDGNTTATVRILDEDSAVLWSEATIAETVTTVFKDTNESSATLPMNIPVAGAITIGCDALADPGASGLICNVVLYGD